MDHVGCLEGNKNIEKTIFNLYYERLLSIYNFIMDGYYRKFKSNFFVWDARGFGS